MAGFLIAAIAAVLPFVLGMWGLGRPRVVLGVGGVLAIGWIFALAAQLPEAQHQIPLWLLAGLVLLLYAIWCGGLFLGLRFRRIRRTTPG